jgi:hypothetical protein
MTRTVWNPLNPANSENKKLQEEDERAAVGYDNVLLALFDALSSHF